MRTFIKYQSSDVYGSGWTKKHVWDFSDSKLITEYEKLHSNLRKVGIKVNQPLKRHASLLDEPPAKRLKSADVADAPKDVADPFSADGGQVHSPSVLTQVDATSDDTPDTGTTDASKPNKDSADAQLADTVGGYSIDIVPPQSSVNVEELAKSQATQEQYVPAEGPQSVATDAPTPIPTDATKEVSLAGSDAPDSDIPYSDVSSPSSTPRKRKKSIARKRVSKTLDLPAEDISFIEFVEEDDKDPVLWIPLVKWELTKNS